MSTLEILVALAIAVGIVGVVLPILPGTLLIAAAVVVWAAQVGGTTAWILTGLALLLLVAGGIVKYLLPGRNLKRSGIPNESLLIGAVLGIVGFFVIPVIGIVIGFAGGIYLAEAKRVGPAEAKVTTWAAVKAAGLSMLIEFVAAVLAAATWATAVVIT
ncbi:DUF456 domain-containing protein [Nocardioides daejeonensis]|uniref:DUF456 domain-containing protein n=1 Tax=Nocardioides daejeonensis TaxID=1046556 RepID=UPI000D745ED4|nr:DUF456 domain-containing protein [Nocardioides daejeonensis]